MKKDDKQGFGKLVSLREAKKIISNITKEVDDERVSLDKALHRVLSEDIVSDIDVPHFRKSAMDGFAVIASDTFGASNTNSKELKIIDKVIAGIVSKKKLKKGECIEITTGAAMPEGADAVLMVEYTEKEKDKLVFYKSVAPGDNVIKIGSDVKKGSLLLKRGTLLDPRLTGVLSSIGKKTILVKKIPRISVLSTGNEIISADKELEIGKIYDINSRTLIDSIKEMHCIPLDLGVVGDEEEVLKKKIIEGVEKSDLVIMSGGSSLGSEDLTKEVVQELGELLVHGIAVKPGKPVIIAKIKGKAFIGLPGYPTSALSNFHIMVKPVIHSMLGLKEEKNFVEAKLARKIASTIGRYEFLAVKLERSGEKDKEELIAVPVMKGSSAITTMSTADGFVEIDENTEVLNKRESVKVSLF
ncbi:MAG: molybdopterin molybdenumtransferase MoeA [Nanoarchaeota archaeon]|nr:molybdopterin molybdenumtransferase MoeA [Nanoarchaeota archaeon]MBU1321943.1 molybdopterin molybdenumtransferase MoeA [Nanoarchaeota archaeon]MBU1597939.1 molybdopterin molybdenumtransferase MoeA [Nanoarchaeota archaeon]MBU2441176.1 molybdopterin molybdenumtransferase MoeA [Nanoarchaeota archaeon]